MAIFNLVSRSPQDMIRITDCITDWKKINITKMDGNIREKMKKNPREGANFFNAVTYTWMLEIFHLGYKRDLELEDLYEPLKEHKSNIMGDKLAAVWRNHLESCKKKNRNKNNIPINLRRVLIRVFGARFAFYGLIALLMEVVMRVIQPLVLGRFVQYFIDDNISVNEAYIYASCIILTAIINVIFESITWMEILHIGMKIRVSCCSLIYRKALKLSKIALNETTVGQAVNLLSNDVSRFDTTLLNLHYLWIAPLQTIIASYFMYTEAGWAAIGGVFVLVIFIPLEGWLGNKLTNLRLSTAAKTDERVRLTNEMIHGIQTIKMHTWENPFRNVIKTARSSEMNIIRCSSYIKSIFMSFSMFISRLALYVAILGYIFNDGTISTEKVFILTAYYANLQHTVTIFFPLGVMQLAELNASIKRVQQFLMYNEIEYGNQSIFKDKIIENFSDKKKSQSKSELSLLLSNVEENENKSILFDNVYAKWLDSDQNYALNGINLNIKSGELVAVVGKVGSGKSSLLHAILKELPIKSGNINVPEKISYASQEPWLFSSSIRQNILFGSPMDFKKYNEVIKVCQLKRDFAQLPHGDRTIISEDGISLSGGQKARINLARAVYTNALLYLFDDPLSALDVHVGKHIYEECINKYLHGHTRILVTHQIQLLHDVDKIIVMKDGGVFATGTYRDLINMGIDFENVFDQGSFVDELEKKSSSHSHKNSRGNIISMDTFSASNMKKEDENELKEVEETRETGKIDSSIWKSYIKSGGNYCIIFLAILPFIAAQLSGSGVDWFLTYWIKIEENDNRTIFNTNETSISNNTLTISDTLDSMLSKNTCRYIFSGLIFLTIIISITRSFAIYEVFIRASKRLHNALFYSITRATMYFFNTNTSGRILNRFSKDMGLIDELLPVTVIECIQIALGVIGTIVVITISNPWLLIPTVIISILYYLLRAFYIETSRSVKRIEGVTRSPVYNHFCATLKGLATIRSFEAGEILTKEFDRHQDLHSSTWYIVIASSRALSFWLDSIFLIYIIAVIMSFLLLPEDSEFRQGANVGLAITQCIGITGKLSYGMRQTAELENQMTSVERVIEYTNIESESPTDSETGKKPPKNWPPEGNIEFKNVYLSYGLMQPIVLNHINFTINSQERVGIVGRTGAGKTSIVSALFRLANVKGTIEIDGIDLGTIGLHDCRSKISIIPQNPFLFSGSLRKNIDPCQKFDDSALYAALEHVGMKELRLDFNINNDGGTNFSIGQRQLICLARAIINKNKILILDEATANVDSRTDAFVQETIRKMFSDCTLIIITHRLHNVIDSDKILVMDTGNIVEFDHPHILLQNESGFFSNMVRETGNTSAKILAAIAKETYEKYQSISTSTIYTSKNKPTFDTVF
ncbi:hypothetical protein PV326_007800 [Microctonus aethiopoides]|nr:hypothetical protein PV326_007800 [Microctonus aethiopoides]